jgi:hypothetical protein
VRLHHDDEHDYMYRGYSAIGIGHCQFDVCQDSHSMVFYKNKGTQTDGTDDVIGPQPTVTLWVAPTSGQRYHLDKDCGKLLCAKATKCYTACQQCG